MTFFKKLALTAALSVLGVAGAHAAAVEYTTFDLSNSTEGTAGVYTGTYAIDSVTGAKPTDIDGQPIAPRVAGDTFVDDFVLRIQDAQYVSFYAFVNAIKVPSIPRPSASFSSITLYDFQGGVYVPDERDDENRSFFEDGLLLGSGSYALEITGTIDITGGGYTGQLTTSPVPEPSGLALMLAGIGALGALARRRTNNQA